MPPAGLRARAPWHRQERHRGGDGAEHPGDLRGAFRRADVRCGAEHAEHAPGCGDARVHAGPWRRQGADHRPRIFQDHRDGIGADTGKADRHRYRRPDLRGRQAGRRDDLRGIPARGRSGLRLAEPGGRVGCDRAELHLRHHRGPEGRGVSPSRRLPERAVQHRELGHEAARGLSLDAADVPLQRLVLPVVGGGARRHQCLPAAGGRTACAGPDPQRTGDAYVRRADRLFAAGQCAEGALGRDRPCGRRPGRRRVAARGADRGCGTGRHRADPCLRPDRELWPGLGLRQA